MGRRAIIYIRYYAMGRQLCRHRGLEWKILLAPKVLSLSLSLSLSPPPFVFCFPISLSWLCPVAKPAVYDVITRGITIFCNQPHGHHFWSGQNANAYIHFKQSASWTHVKRQVRLQTYDQT